MKIYRKLVPKIAKDVVRSLLANKLIEIEDGHRDDAELDLAGAVVGYLNQLDQVTHDAREAMERHNLAPELLGRIKRSIAETRKVVTGEESTDHVVQEMVSALFESKYVEEVFGEDHDLKKIAFASLRKYLGVDEELDREVRGRLRNLREGTAEWEIEYSRLVDHMRAQKSL